MKRRDFVTDGTKATLVGLAGLTGLGARPATPPVTGPGTAARLARAPGGPAPVSRTDLVIRHGTLIDGTGAPPRTGDIAITGDRISAIGRVPATGTVEIDARGMAVAPGFIDIHSHADLSLLVNPRAESRVRQGVTLEVVGQDGSSIGPWSDGAFESTRDRYRRNYDVEIDFRDIGGFLDRIDRERPAVSVASMIGHGTIRGYVIGGADRPATDAELARMRALVRDGLAAGAVGLSTGLEYTPGSFATRDELVALATELRGTPYPYASHMRNEDDRLLAAVEEALYVGRMAGVPVQISHLTVRLLRDAGGSVGMIGFGMSEENTERILAHPLGMVCSDGGAYAPYGALSGSSPHPRGYGSFPRLLGHYVRDRKSMALEVAVHKISGLPARKLGLEDRGVLRVGAVADVVVFDPGSVADRATFEDPHQYPVGISHVVVGGVHTIRDGEQTGRMGGRGVRGVGVGR